VRPVAATPAVAGFRHTALAVAAAFALQGGAHAQSVPIGAVWGSATFQRNGNNLLVTTTNGAGNRSVLNWQSFSVPAGSTTWFQQPDAASTSINRVTGGVRSDIFGTLGSNGRLVLVNPSGIAFGAGATVDTAGFTASTLGLSEADAIAGRMRFEGGAGSLNVGEGAQILARNGDVVLVGSQVQVERNAVVRAQGNTILAAGEKVEITGRGLEGIQLEVQAGNQAVNLGTLQGDAVGIFAETLKHSGLVQARAVSAEGGKVVLRAIGGDALVDGTVTATGNGGKGGSVDVLGERVGLLAGAVVDVSGVNGGGSVRIGGDYQGKNPDVPNAKRTYVDAQATIKADATEQGDGGRVIVWSDELTRMNGQISARGGAQGGSGGFAEVSGKQTLEFTGRADLRAPLGTTGTLLLDPNDIVIDATASTDTTSNGLSGGIFTYSGGDGTSHVNQADIESQLATASVTVQTSAGTGGSGNITVNSGVDIQWSTNNAFTLQADGSISLQGSITGTGSGSSVSLLALGGGVTQTAGVVTTPNLTVRAAGNIAMGTQPNQVDALTADSTLNSDAIGSINFTNGRGLMIQGANAGTNDVTIATNAGNLTVAPPPPTAAPVVAGNNVTLKAQGAIDLQGQVTASGVATFTAVTGGLTQESGATVTAGSVVMQANQDITLNDNVYGQGGIGITSDAGAIMFTELHAEGIGSSATTVNGGNVTLQASGDIQGGTISADGAFYSVGQTGPISGNGGTVSVTSSNGGISIGQITARSGSYSAEYGGVTAGAAGNVNLLTTTTTGVGDIYVGMIDVGGGNATGTGNPDLPAPTPTSGGTVTVEARQGNVQLDDVYAVGGGFMGPDGVAGAAGGKLIVTASGNITLGEVQVNGGSTDSGVGGQGGVVQLTTGGNIVGGISTECTSCTNYFDIEAVGGNGGTDASGNGLRGGTGGTVQITRTGGDLAVDSSYVIAADGGAGGSANMVLATNLGGVGGDGGNVTLSASGVVNLSDGSTISAVGGQGGANGDDSTSAANGALGTFRATGTSVNVTGTVLVAANWINDSSVTVAASGAAEALGTFQNNGTVDLSDSSILAAQGGVVNAGVLTANGNGAIVTLLQNTGTVDVKPGASLMVPTWTASDDVTQMGFAGNDGTLNVDGTLTIATLTPPSLAPTPGVFTNNATGVISGTGTLMVDDGTSTLNNFGTIAPAGVGTIGTLTLNANLVMESGSTLAADLLNTSSYDNLVVTGSTTSGGGVAVNYLTGAAFSAGDRFRVVQSASLDATTLPTVSQPQLLSQANGSDLLLVAISGYPPPPPPPPAPPAPVAPPDQVNAQQQTNNQVVTFAELFVQMAEQQQDDKKGIGKDDIVVTDTACTR
jgi:filamentous hemagglutinin family protein